MCDLIEITGMTSSVGDNGALTGGWWAWLLSRGGRLVLLKVVLSAIPAYFMSLFRVPVGVCKRMEAIMRNFFLAWSRNIWDLGTCIGKMECGLPPHVGGRPRGQKSPTHQYDAAYEVGPQIDTSSIKYGHLSFDGQLRDSARLGAAL